MKMMILRLKMKVDDNLFKKYMHVELSLVSLADSTPSCCALLPQLDGPLGALRHTLAFVVESPEIRDGILRLEL